MIEGITEKAVVCLVNEPSPVAYLNLYEAGDVWVKIQGCEACPLERRKRCCGECPLFAETGCVLHLQKTAKGGNKPFKCVTTPHPDSAKGDCRLIYKCVAGSKKGKIRRVGDRGNVFVETA